jgi:outer membrane protein TolC
MIRFNLILSFLSLLIISTKAQDELLSKNQAVELALEYNYNILVADNDIDIAKNNTSIYNNGYLPTISLNTGANYYVNSSKSIMTDGTETNANGIGSNSMSAGIGVNYTLYNGLARKYNYAILKENYNLTELHARQIIENTMLHLFSLYYEIARLRHNQQSLEQTLSISKNRLKKARYGYEYGQNTMLDILNAEVNFNTDSINYLNITQELKNSKRNLNVLLGRNVDHSFFVDTTVIYTKGLLIDQLISNAMERNVNVLQNRSNTITSEYEIIVSKSGYLPQIYLNSGYGWDRNFNGDLASIRTQNTYGFNAGLSISWNIFDGGQTRTNILNSKIKLENQQILNKQIEKNLELEVINTWDLYNNTLFVLDAELKNLKTNQHNFKRTQEQFKLGQITSIEFREAQQNLLTSQLNVHKAKFDAKIAELSLLQLTGNLLNAIY